MAEGMPNVRFEGLLGGESLARLFHGARAVVVPSLFPETFGYVVLEAFAVRTPVVVHRGGGAILETGERSGGGLGYDTDAEMLVALKRVVHDEGLRNELAAAGFAMREGPWSEETHPLCNYPRPDPSAAERGQGRDDPPRTAPGRSTQGRSAEAGRGRESDVHSVARPGSVALLLILPVVSGVCFHRLIASPGSLIVDGHRESVDHADRGHSRGLGNDLTSVFLPRFCYVVGQTRENGRRPAWDASGFGGRPLVGNPQAGLNYPPVWLAWWSGRLSALGWLTAAHLLGAGAGVYVLTRSLGLGRPAAVVAGGCFQASPYLIAHTFEGHYPHVWSACWYPWAFWGLSLALRRRAVGYWVLPGVLALTFLTGHPQEWYFLVVAISVWVATADAKCEPRAGDPGRKEGFGRVAVWVGLLGLSLCLCAVEFVAANSPSDRGLLEGEPRPLAHVNRYQLHALNLLQLLSPFALGRPADYVGHDNYWETVLSIGLAPLVLAVLGLCLHEDRRETRRWGILVALSVVFAAGRRLGLYALAYAVLPGMERFRVPSRTLFLASLGASVLAPAPGLTHS